ncbi:MAG: caspase family protein [Saprospiraceae bacterium]
MNKNFFLALLCLTFTFHNNTAAQCISGNCISGTGTYVYPSGAKYSGQFSASQINGIGTLWMKSGDTYTGQWSNNYKEGNGIFKFANGDIYKGSFVHSKFEGLGIMTYNMGGSYKGEWLKNLPHGKGVYTYANGEKYEGLLTEGVRQGFGKYYYEDRSVYDGQWKDNLRDGQGTMVYADGKKNSGTWKEDKLSGNNEQTLAATTDGGSRTKIRWNSPTNSNIASSNQEANGSNQDSNKPAVLKNCNDAVCNNENGVYIFKDGSKYVGPFKNGNPYGKGIVYYANGDRYEGEWDDIAPQGQGMMYFTSGRVYAAIWDHGRPVKQLDQRLALPTSKTTPDQNDEVKIWSVVVGVARYDHMPVLKYADDDAYQIYAFLKSPEGGAIPDSQIKILIDEDATRNNIINAIQEQFGKADENDVVMLYYSGHGVNGAFLPIDFDGYNNKLYHDEVNELMASSHAKHKLCLIDACYAGNMSDANAVKADFSASLNNYYSILNHEKGGTAFILSCKNREVSLEDSGLRQGIFSHYLIRGLKGDADRDRNKVVTVQELYDFISTQVKAYTGNVQNPLIEGNYNPNMPVATIRDK